MKKFVMLVGLCVAECLLLGGLSGFIGPATAATANDTSSARLHADRDHLAGLPLRRPGDRGGHPDSDTEREPDHQPAGAPGSWRVVVGGPSDRGHRSRPQLHRRGVRGVPLRSARMPRDGERSRCGDSGDLLDPRRELPLPRGCCRRAVPARSVRVRSRGSGRGGAIAPAVDERGSVLPGGRDRRERGAGTVLGAVARGRRHCLRRWPGRFLRRAPRSNERSDGGLAQQRDLWRDRTRWHGERRVRPVRLDAERHARLLGHRGLLARGHSHHGDQLRRRRVTGAGGGRSRRVRGRGRRQRGLTGGRNVGRFSLQPDRDWGPLVEPLELAQPHQRPADICPDTEFVSDRQFEQRRRGLRFRADAPGDEPVGALLLPGR